MDSKQVKELKRFAAQARIECLKMMAHLGVAHVGGSLSIIDLLSVLYKKQMRIDPKNPKWPDRDYLVVSKGHSGPGVYAVLALRGYFPVDMLLTLNQGGTKLPSHCDRNLTPGIDMTTGSLGQGGSVAVGIALGNRRMGRDNYTYVLIGDGEMNEGQIWEMAELAPQYKLDNLIAIVDNNKLQIDGPTKDVVDLGDLTRKFEEFGWFAVDCEGHDVESIDEAIEKCKKSGKPGFINMHTVKGKGLPDYEGKVGVHNMPLNMEMIKPAVEKLEAEIKALS